MGHRGPSDGNGGSETETDTINSKVARLIETYDLGSRYGERLEALWTAEGDERESLRELADRFNKRLLKAAMADAGMATLNGEISNLYRLLTDADVSSGNRTEARTRLEQGGVDVEQLETDFITYQAMRTYLKEYRGADYESTSSSARVSGIIDTIQRLKSRVRSVAEKNLEQIGKTDQLTLGEFRLFVDIEVLCEDCGTQRDIVELLREGGCDCTREGG